jgi:hypothetical protein
MYKIMVDIKENYDSDTVTENDIDITQSVCIDNISSIADAIKTLNEHYKKETIKLPWGITLTEIFYIAKKDRVVYVPES